MTWAAGQWPEEDRERRMRLTIRPAREACFLVLDSSSKGPPSPSSSAGCGGDRRDDSALSSFIAASLSLTDPRNSKTRESSM